MFLCGNHWRFWTFSILWIWNKFSERRLLKSRSIVFLLKVLQNISIQNTLSKANDKTNTPWKLSKYRVIFGLYYPVFRLNVENKQKYISQINKVLVVFFGNLRIRFSKLLITRYWKTWKVSIQDIRMKSTLINIESIHQ